MIRNVAKTVAPAQVIVGQSVRSQAKHSIAIKWTVRFLFAISAIALAALLIGWLTTWVTFWDICIAGTLILGLGGFMAYVTERTNS